MCIRTVEESAHITILEVFYHEIERCGVSRPYSVKYHDPGVRPVNQPSHSTGRVSANYSRVYAHRHTHWSRAHRSSFMIAASLMKLALTSCRCASFISVTEIRFSTTSAPSYLESRVRDMRDQSSPCVMADTCTDCVRRAPAMCRCRQGGYHADDDEPCSVDRTEAPTREIFLID